MPTLAEIAIPKPIKINCLKCGFYLGWGTEESVLECPECGFQNEIGKKSTSLNGEKEFATRACQ